MILVFSILCASGYVLLNLFQAVYVGLYSKRMSRSPSRAKSDEFQPSTYVVLCLRGSDPSLPNCLAGLAAQSHTNYRLVCVVDDLLDPALDSLKPFATQFQHPPKTLLIDQPSSTRSLKCSALLTAFNDLLAMESPPEVVAMVDADAHCDPDWLNDLIAPLADRAIDATTGNRWFEPRDQSLGSWVRQIWNAAAVVQMNLYGIPWGGSLAFRTSLLTQTNFCDRLQNAFCEDTLLSDVLRQNKRKLYSVNQLVVGNNESTDLAATRRFITRQLLTTKLYHWSWPLVVFHALNIFVLNLLALVGLGFALTQADWPAATIFLACIIISQLFNAAFLRWIGNINRRQIAARPDSAVGSPEVLISAPKYMMAVATSPWVHAWATFIALFRKRISWRGIDYEIGRAGVRMLQYQPFRPDQPEDQSID